jgi:hypothetical protein
MAILIALGTSSRSKPSCFAPNLSTFVHPQCEGDTGSSAATFQKLRFELGFQKLVCGALVDEQLCQARAIFKQSTSVVSSPALLIAAEISIECLLAPWTVHG